MQLEDKINKLNKIEIAATSAFLTMGFTAYALSHPLVSVAMSPTFPFFASSLLSYFQLKRNFSLAISSNFLTDLYSTRVTKWVNRYIENSNNYIETKSKFIFFGIWLDSKKINDSFIKIRDNDYLESISERLKKNKTTNHYLIDLFCGGANKNEIYKEFLSENLTNNLQRKNIDTIYSEFKNEGWLGKNFNYVGGTKFSICAELQNYNLTPEDIKEIKKLTKSIEKRGTDFIGFVPENKELYIKIIKNNLLHIDILKEYFKSNLDNTLSSNYLIKEILKDIEQIDTINKRIDSLETFLATKADLSDKKQIQKI